MTFLYTVRGTYDKSYNEGDILSWEKYIEWSKLTHLTEVVSLDYSLNELLVEPDYNNGDDWAFFYVSGMYDTALFTSLDYVLKKAKKKEKFNLLAVIVEPNQDCQNIELDDYTFIGYDLLDKYFEHSALTNCGGYDETFLPSDLNTYGLIDDYTKAYDIHKRLLENNPNEGHADTNVIAIWRHSIIGR